MMTAARPYFLTTPIYYVNDLPHLGHAYTTVACDALARFMRLDGYRVKFLTGSDEHGQKVEQSARAAGIGPQEFCDRISPAWREMTKLLNISNDDFIRTTEPRHVRGVEALWQELEKRGEIYLGRFAGWYAVRDETFWPADLHMVGKDIVRFHTVYWHAFLMAAGLEPPRRVFAHGWWTVEGQKMSKSLGNFIPPKALVDKYGLDPVRYFLLRELPFGSDGDFSHRAMVGRLNGDLANDYGNLAQRVLAMINRNCDPAVPGR